MARRNSRPNDDITEFGGLVSISSSSLIRFATETSTSSRVTLNSTAIAFRASPSAFPLRVCTQVKTVASKGSIFRAAAIKSPRTRFARDWSIALASNFAHSCFKTSRSSLIAPAMSGIATEGLTSYRFLTPRSRRIFSVSGDSSAHRRARLCLTQSPMIPTRS